MSLSSRSKNKLIDTINTTFASIGEATGMKMPRSGNNLEPLAWEMFIAKHLLSLAAKRKEVAEGRAAKAGVINDKEKKPLPEGTKEVLFRGEVVTIMVEVRKSGERIDGNKVVEWLAAAGVDETLLAEAVKLATTFTKPAHVYDPVLVTTEAINNGK